MNVTPSPEVCQMAFQLSRNFLLQMIILSKVVISIIGVGCTAYFLIRRGLRWLIHPNAKVIFCFHMIFTMGVSVGYAFNYAYDFNRLRSKHADPCSYAMPLRFAFHTRIISIIFLYAQIYTMLGFAIERAISTVILAKYETIKKPYLGWGIGFCSLILGAAIEYGVLAPGLNWDSFVPTYSLRTVDNAQRFTINLHFQFAVQLATILIFWRTLSLNDRMYRKQKLVLNQRLANKYQVAENQRVIRILLPCFVAHFIISTTTALGMSMYPLFFAKWDPVTYAQWVESFNQMHIYSVVMPILLHFRLRSTEVRVEVDRNLSSDAYFRSFNAFINETRVNVV